MKGITFRFVRKNLQWMICFRKYPIIIKKGRKGKMDMNFDRHRRLRSSANMRALVRETHLRAEDFIYPLFIVEGKQQKQEISSMPGIYQISLDLMKQELDEIVQLGIKAVILFGVPEEK